MAAVMVTRPAAPVAVACRLPGGDLCTRDAPDPRSEDDGVIDLLESVERRVQIPPYGVWWARYFT